VVQGRNDKGGMSLCDVAIEVGLFGMGEMGSPQMGNGSEGHKNSWFVSMFVESEPGMGVMWVVKMDLGVGLRVLIH